MARPRVSGARERKDRCKGGEERKRTPRAEGDEGAVIGVDVEEREEREEEGQ